MGKRHRKTPNADSWRAPYKEIAKDNALLVQYYDTIVPEADQEAFWKTLRTPLPATFRVAATGSIGDFLAGDLQKIPFVPNAWKLPTSRKELRKDEQYERLHGWLTAGTEAGVIYRQEAVSMLPPLFLAIDSPSLTVLDMCAAPGSKTSQILELLDNAAHATGQPLTGLVVANDADKNRAFMLHHQVRRLHSPALLVTCNDASRFPSLVGPEGRRLQFDRVLCDVPCSGDGTLRKTPSIWASWTPNQPHGLHSLQRRILERGVGVLKPGGRLVYSTCSLNPVEDEAVVAAVLTKHRGQLRLLPSDDIVPLALLKRRPGMSSWKVMAADGVLYADYPGDAEAERLRLHRTFFPPRDAAWMHLEHAFRVLPHDQDTGGFFVAVFEKTPCNGDGSPDGHGSRDSDHGNGDVAGSGDNNAGHEDSSRNTITISNSKFDQYHVVDSSAPLITGILQKYFDPAPSLPGAFLTRSMDFDGPHPRSFVYCTALVASIIAASSAAAAAAAARSSLRIVNCGVRAFERYEPSARHASDTYDCRYRMLSEFLYLVRQHHSAGLRTAEVDRGVFERLLGTDTTVAGVLDGAGAGGVVIACGDLLMSVWRTEDGHVRPFISKQDRSFILQSLK